MWRCIAYALPAALVVVPVTSSAQVLLDDYESSAFSLSDTTTTGVEQSTQNGLTLCGGLTNSSRDVQLNLLTGSQLDASLALTGGDDGVVYTVSASSGGSLFVTAFCASAVDLSGYDGLRVTLSQAPSTGDLSGSGISNTTGIFGWPDVPFTGPGEYFLPFSSAVDLGGDEIDFSTIVALGPVIEATAAGSALTYEISESSVVSLPDAPLVPSLGTNGLLLLALSLTAFGWSRSGPGRRPLPPR